MPDSLEGAPPECGFGDLTVADANNMLPRMRLSPERMEQYRAHATVCAYCRWVRSRLGAPAFRGSSARVLPHQSGETADGQPGIVVDDERIE